MAELEGDRFITDRECALRSDNIEKSLERIEEYLGDIKGDNARLNTAFIELHSQVQTHVAVEEQAETLRTSRWSSLQIVMVSITATAAVGMFILNLVK